MGACAKVVEKQNNPQQELWNSSIVEPEGIHYQENIKTDTYVIRRKLFSNNLKVKVPKKRQILQTQPVENELTYNIEQQQNLMQLKINIRKSSQTPEGSPSKWMMDDQISIFDDVKEQHEVEELGPGIQLKPEGLNIEEILASVIQLAQKARDTRLVKKLSMTYDSDCLRSEIGNRSEPVSS